MPMTQVSTLARNVELFWKQSPMAGAMGNLDCTQRHSRAAFCERKMLDFLVVLKMEFPDLGVCRADVLPLTTATTALLGGKTSDDN